LTPDMHAPLKIGLKHGRSASVGIFVKMEAERDFFSIIEKNA